MDSDPTMTGASKRADPAPAADGPSSVDRDRAGLERVLAGDPDAFGDLVERHEGRLRALVAGIVADRQVVEDVVQETFFVAYRRLETFRCEASFSTWLTRIAIREATRARTRFRRIVGRWVPLDESQDAGRGRPGDRSESRDEVLAILRRLPDRERVPFVLHVLEGRKYEEIADLLGVPAGTVGSHISRARTRLKKLWPDAAGPSARSGPLAGAEPTFERQPVKPSERST